MNIKRIIREEIDNNLLMEGKLNDMFKKFNMTQIKKELKERLDIDETSTKMEVAKKLIKYSYKLNLKLLKYELGAILGGFIFYFLSAVLDITGVEPFVTDGEPTMPHFILWGAGALLNVIRMVRKDLKEEDGLQWIKNVKSNQDIAEELFNQTVITKDKGIVKFPFMTSNIHPLNHYFDLSIRKKYGEDKDSDDIWERYKVLVNNRLKELTDKSIKESNDLQWISDVKSDEDVAQEIIDKTEIVKDTDGNIRIKSDFVSHTIEGEDFYYDSATYFIEHLENYYGIEDLNHVSRIWKRYKKGVATKIDKELGIVNESNDFSWIDEIPKWDFYNGSYYIDISELDEDEACEVQQLILDMDINWQDAKGLQTGHCNTFINKGYIIRNATLYRTTKNWDDYMKLLGGLKKSGWDGDYGPITYVNGRTDLLN